LRALLIRGSDRTVKGKRYNSFAQHRRSTPLMSNSLNLNPELLQEAIDLDTTTPIEPIIEAALREYIAQHNRLKLIELFGTIDYDDDPKCFGDSVLAFRATHNLSQMDLNPDEIWAGVRDTRFTGREVSFE
jgi:hypothetical protein